MCSFIERTNDRKNKKKTPGIHCATTLQITKDKLERCCAMFLHLLHCACKIFQFYQHANVLHSKVFMETKAHKRNIIAVHKTNRKCCTLYIKLFCSAAAAAAATAMQKLLLSLSLSSSLYFTIIFRCVLLQFPSSLAATHCVLFCFIYLTVLVMPRSCVKKFAIRNFRMSFFSCCSCCFSIRHTFTLSCMHTNSCIKTRTIPNRKRFNIAALSSLSFYVWSKLFTFFYTTTCWCNIYLNGKHGAMYKYRVHNKMHGKFKFPTRTNAIQCPHTFLFDLFKMQPFFGGAFIAWEQKKIIIYRIKCSYEKKSSINSNRCERFKPYEDEMCSSSSRSNNSMDDVVRISHCFFRL